MICVFLLHWVIATNGFFVCCTELLQQTKFVYPHKSMSKRAKNASLFALWALFGTVLPFFGLSFACFGIFLTINTDVVCRSDSVQQTKKCLSQWLSATNKKLFVAVTQGNKQNNCLSQWLSATNKSNHCHSDSVQETILIKKKYPISLLHVTKTLEKKPKTNSLSNLNFTTALKLLCFAL